MCSTGWLWGLGSRRLKAPWDLTKRPGHVESIVAYLWSLETLITPQISALTVLTSPSLPLGGQGPGPHKTINFKVQNWQSCPHQVKRCGGQDPSSRATSRQTSDSGGTIEGSPQINLQHARQQQWEKTWRWGETLLCAFPEMPCTVLSPGGKEPFRSHHVAHNPGCALKSLGT